MKMWILAMMLCLIGMACTDQEMARQWGGESSIEIPCGQKVQGVSWKSPDMTIWVLYRPMRSDESPERWVYHENSSWGMIEGTVVVQETRCAQ